MDYKKILTYAGLVGALTFSGGCRSMKKGVRKCTDLIGNSVSSVENYISDPEIVDQLQDNEKGLEDKLIRYYQRPEIRSKFMDDLKQGKVYDPAKQNCFRQKVKEANEEIRQIIDSRMLYREDSKLLLSQLMEYNDDILDEHKINKALPLNEQKPFEYYFSKYQVLMDDVKEHFSGLSAEDNQMEVSQILERYCGNEMRSMVGIDERKIPLAVRNHHQKIGEDGGMLFGDLKQLTNQAKYTIDDYNYNLKPKIEKTAISLNKVLEKVNILGEDGQECVKNINLFTTNLDNDRKKLTGNLEDVIDKQVRPGIDEAREVIPEIKGLLAELKEGVKEYRKIAPIVEEGINSVKGNIDAMKEDVTGTSSSTYFFMGCVALMTASSMVQLYKNLKKNKKESKNQKVVTAGSDPEANQRKLFDDNSLDDRIKIVDLKENKEVSGKNGKGKTLSKKLAGTFKNILPFF